MENREEKLERLIRMLGNKEKHNFSHKDIQAIRYAISFIRSNKNNP